MITKWMAKTPLNLWYTADKTHKCWLIEINSLTLTKSLCFCFYLPHIQLAHIQSRFREIYISSAKADLICVNPTVINVCIDLITDYVSESSIVI